MVVRKHLSFTLYAHCLSCFSIPLFAMIHSTLCAQVMKMSGIVKQTETETIIAEKKPSWRLWMRWGIPNVAVKWKYSEHSYRVSNPDPQCGRADAVRHCTMCFVTSYNCIALPINAAVVVHSQKGGKIFFCSLSQATFFPTSCQLTIKNRIQLICCLKMPCSYGTRRL